MSPYFNGLLAFMFVFLIGNLMFDGFSSTTGAVIVAACATLVGALVYAVSQKRSSR